ncbi:VCBS repeat-containing protein [Candidatus Fermentibacterales bacterium]|nr:VCBS repeat-containing protein [Candidatus Fermentibacterales bacterium]
MSGITEPHAGTGLSVLFLLACTLTAIAQPYPDIMWWFDLDAPSFGSAACADIDGDGHLEIVFGTYFNGESIHALNAEDGSELWCFPTGGCNDASPVIYDVDLDGQLEVIAPASSPQMVYCLSGTNAGIEWSTDLGHCIDSPPAVGDMDSDGKPEIVLGTFNGWVYCLEGESGEVSWECSLGTASYIQSGPCLLDLDSDADLDAVVAQWLGDLRVYGLDGSDGSIIWSCDDPEGNMYHGGSFADVDEDGRDEIAIGSYDASVYLLNSEDGSVEWQYPLPYYVGGPTSIADLNNDGHLEIVYAAHTRIGALTHDGAQLWQHTSGGSCFRGAAVANINGDSTPDVIYGGSDGHLTALRGTDGGVIWDLDLQAHYGNTFDIDHAPTVADFDEDGGLDVFVVGGYGTSSSPQDNHGRAYAVAAGSGAGPGWPMFRHDRYHSACFDTTGTGCHGAPSCPWPLRLSAFPNPFTSGLEILIRMQDPGYVDISAFDLTGRRVATIYEGPLPQGESRLAWPAGTGDFERLGCGAYFVRLSSGPLSAAVRVLRLR